MDVTPIEVGETVTYFNEYGKPHPALVTAVWGPFEWTDEQRENPTYAALIEAGPPTIPSINLVFVEKDELKHDSYGRQIARATSVVHATLQSAHGRFWQNI